MAKKDGSRQLPLPISEGERQEIIKEQIELFDTILEHWDMVEILFVEQTFNSSSCWFTLHRYTDKKGNIHHAVCNHEKRKAELWGEFCKGYCDMYEGTTMSIPPATLGPNAYKVPSHLKRTELSKLSPLQWLELKMYRSIN